MIIKDSDNLAELLLENWGRWCFSRPYRHLGYSEQPMFKDYIPPKREPRKPSLPISEDDALIANVTILHIRIKECPFDETPKGIFSVYDLIRQKWALNQPARALADYYGCSTRTIRRRSQRARDEFLAEYMLILSGMKKVNSRAA